MAASAQSPLPPDVPAIPHELRPVIRPIGKTTAPHASTPHSTTATTTKPTPTPSWLNSAALTPKQMDAQATSEANASVAPQVTGIQQQQQNYDAQQKAYEAAMTGFYAALAPYMAGIRGQVSDAYNSAGATMGGIAHDYSGVLGASARANADATTAALTRAGQTQAIPAAQAQANPGSALTDAFSATHGGIAGASFAEQGAAKAADAAQKPAIWAAQGRDSMTEAINKAVAGDQKYADQIKNIYATVPGLRDTILKQIQSAELDKAKYAADQKNTAFDQAYKTHEAALGDAKFKASQSNTAFNQKATIARINLESQKAARAAYQSDRTYQIQLANLGIRQKSLQLQALADEAKLQNGGFTPIQVQKFKGTSVRLTDNAFNGIQAVDKSGNPMTKNGQPVWAHPPLNYQQAIREARKEGIPLSIAIPALNERYAPGERGRPLTYTANDAFSPQFAGAPGNASTALLGGTSFRSSKNGGGFVPDGTQVTIGRADQGRDIQMAAGSPIIAPGSGVVVRVASDPGSGGRHFGPSYPVVRFTSGPYAGKTMYIGHTTAALKPGARFAKGQVISVTGSGGPESGGAPPGWAEIGFAPGGTPGGFGQEPPF